MLTHICMNAHVIYMDNNEFCLCESSQIMEAFARSLANAPLTQWSHANVLTHKFLSL